MHDLLKEHLEGRLSGNLPAEQKQLLEEHLAGCAACQEEWKMLERSAGWLRQWRPPEEGLEPAPGFYARVMERIDHQREAPFWAMLVDPAFGRRLVFACLLLLAVVGAYVADLEPASFSNRHSPEAVLAGQPNLLPSPRLGPDLQRNREAMLATLVAIRH